VPAAAAVLIDCFTRALASASLPPSTTLASVGACMSGFMEAGPQKELIAALRAGAPTLAAEYWVDNDSPGSVFTAAGGAGGTVIIAGTGTMGQLILPDGSIVSAGGHGHEYGDEGSAYYIAASAIRGIHRADDGFSDDPTGASPLPDVSRARAAMLSYFGIATPEGMLDVMYAHFAKDRIAGFTKSLAGLARGGPGCPDGNAEPDAFAASLFADAGTLLGCKARALAPHALPSGAPPASRSVRDFTIVAVGSVWKSWDLFAAPFVAAATSPFHFLPPHVLHGGPPAPDVSGTGRRLPRSDVTALPVGERGHLSSFRIVRLRVTAAVGSAWRGAQLRAGVTLPLDGAGNCEELYSFDDAS
jgi:hypothetical protein